MFVGALALVGFMRACLTLLPFHRVRRLATRLKYVGAKSGSRATSSAEDCDRSVARIAWAVKSSSRFVPRATCLTQALAAQILLERQGCVAELFIGVARKPGSEIEAHAWIEYGNRIVLGYLDDLARFTRLPPLPEETA